MGMEKINSIAALKERILYLEHLQKTQEEDLKQEFKTLQEALRPASLVKSAAKDLFQSTGFKENALEFGLALISGSFSKKVAFDLLKQPLKKALAGGLKLLVKDKPEPESNSVKSRILNALNDFLANHEKPA